MKILVTAATTLEIQPFLDYLYRQSKAINHAGFVLPNCHISILISGIGLMHAGYHLGRQLASARPDIAIQAGIGGCFHSSWELGKVVVVTTEQLGDLGAEDGEQFKDLFDIQLWQPGQPPFVNRELPNTFGGLPAVPDLPQARGITVNTVSGNLRTIERLQQKYAPDVESMEGAAFHYACLLEQVPFLQLRSISNYVEVRDKSKWQIPLAVKHLNETLIKYIDHV